MARRRIDRQRGTSLTACGVSRKVPIVALVTDIQLLLQRFERQCRPVIPEQVAMRAMRPFDLGLIGRTAFATGHMHQAQADQPERKRRREVRLGRTGIDRFMIGLYLQRQPEPRSVSCASWRVTFRWPWALVVRIA